jgi:3-methyladenine DNA glycosylase/8-oxoguanine DNA glycosylase
MSPAASISILFTKFHPQQWSDHLSLRNFKSYNSGRVISNSLYEISPAAVVGSSLSLQNSTRCSGRIISLYEISNPTTVVGSSQILFTKFHPQQSSRFSLQNSTRCSGRIISHYEISNPTTVVGSSQILFTKFHPQQ